MKTIYIVYTSDFDSYQTIRAFSSKDDAEKFKELLTKISNVVWRDAPEYIKNNIGELPHYPILQESNSFPTGEAWLAAKKQHEENMKEYEILSNEHYSKYNELRTKFIKESLSDEEFSLYTLYPSLDRHIEIEEIDYKE